MSQIRSFQWWNQFLFDSRQWWCQWLLKDKLSFVLPRHLIKRCFCRLPACLVATLAEKMVLSDSQSDLSRLLVRRWFFQIHGMTSHDSWWQNGSAAKLVEKMVLSVNSLSYWTIRKLDCNKKIGTSTVIFSLFATVRRNWYRRRFVCHYWPLSEEICS